MLINYFYIYLQNAKCKLVCVLLIKCIFHQIIGKEARKKELKKNKKQRMIVRTAVLKGKDPLQIIAEMEKIDQMGKLNIRLIVIFGIL